MKKDFKTTFNEVAKLADIVDRLGQNAAPHLPGNVYDALIDRAEQDTFYSSADFKRYTQLKKKGVVAGNYKRATDVYLKVLQQADKNLNLVIKFTNAAFLRQHLPEIDNAREVRKLAKKYGMTSLQKLVA